MSPSNAAKARMDTNEAAAAILQRKAAVFAAMGHPIRLAIVEYLAAGEQCVCDIATAVGAERPNVSRHLAVMLSAGVLSSRKDGLRMIYSLKTPCISDFIGCVERMLSQELAEAGAMLKML